MKQLPLAHVKAHFSELVDDAEHHGERILILRHGKPAAAIVPVAIAMPPEREKRKRPLMPSVTRSVRDFIADFSALEPDVSAVEELLRDRR